MNRLFKYVSVACACVFGLTACVHNLNTTPIDKNSTTGFNQDALFTKIYSTLALTGQQGAAGSPDIEGADEGASGFYRVMWELNQFPSDEGWWIWNDPGVGEARTMEWNGDNALVKMLYDRFIIVIKYCNHFLEYADQSQTYGQQQAAEVRFIRALNYWYMLDMFKYSPFIDRESFDYPEFKSRPELYAWLEPEIIELTTALPANRLSKYRVDQTAAWLLLARLYLNAEVYTGTPQWAKAQEAAENALTGGYTLHKTEKVNKEGIRYSAYQQLFMGDNDMNGAQNEAVLLIYQDGKYCTTYCGTWFNIAATRDAGMVSWGVADSWKCFRTSPEFVSKFFPQLEVADTIKAHEYQMSQYAKDDRAILCSYVEGNPNKWTLSARTAPMAADFYASWACPKFTGLYSTADSMHINLGADGTTPDTDIPFMRIAEAYMTQAEAMFRQGNTAGAMDVINNSVRARANAEPLTALDENTLIDEWSREFWGEGRRRTDLIRFNRFAGPAADANKYHWEGRANASIYKSMPEHWNWFPIPSDDKRVNPNFKKQVIENPENPFATQGGDGYVYAN